MNKFEREMADGLLRTFEPGHWENWGSTYTTRAGSEMHKICVELEKEGKLYQVQSSHTLPGPSRENMRFFRWARPPVIPRTPDQRRAGLSIKVRDED